MALDKYSLFQTQPMSTNQAGISGTTKACSPPLKSHPCNLLPPPKRRDRPRQDSQTEEAGRTLLVPADPAFLVTLGRLQTLSGHQAPLLFGEVFHSDNVCSE